LFSLGLVKNRTLLYIVIAFDLLYIVGLAALPFIFVAPRPVDPVALRNRIEASSSFEDLRPRALLVLSAREAAGRAIAALHRAISHLIRLSIALMIVNIAALWFYVLRPARV
jgi:hypothetical protein